MCSSVAGHISQHYVQSTDHILTTAMTETTAECLSVRRFNVSVVPARTAAVVVTYKHLPRLDGIVRCGIVKWVDGKIPSREIPRHRTVAVFIIRYDFAEFQRHHLCVKHGVVVLKSQSAPTSAAVTAAVIYYAHGSENR